MQLRPRRLNTGIAILFLVSSAFAVVAVGRFFSWRPRVAGWRIAWLNMTGSLAFMGAAFGAFVLPSSGGAISLTWADRGTLVGAVCFFVGALLAIPAWKRVADADTVSETAETA